MNEWVNDSYNYFLNFASLKKLKFLADWGQQLRSKCHCNAAVKCGVCMDPPTAKMLLRWSSSASDQTTCGTPTPRTGDSVQPSVTAPQQVPSYWLINMSAHLDQFDVADE